MSFREVTFLPESGDKEFTFGELAEIIASTERGMVVDYRIETRGLVKTRVKKITLVVSEGIGKREN